MSLWERYEIIRTSSFHLGMPSELQLHNTLNRGSVLVGRLTVGLVFWNSISCGFDHVWIDWMYNKQTNKLPWYMEYSIQLYWMSGPFRVADCGTDNCVDLNLKS